MVPVVEILDLSFFMLREILDFEEAKSRQRNEN
jgi:hypothetical protein